MSHSGFFVLSLLPVQLCRRLTPVYISLLVLAIASFHPASAQDMFTAEDMQQMMEGMQEMQEALDNLDPEMREQIEQMMANPPANTSADDGAEPRGDTAKLAAISTDALDGAALKAYIESLQPKLTAAISSEARARAERISTELARTGDYLPRLRAAANGLAAWGALPEATWLMGKVALASGSAQDMSNLAAFLSMQRAEAAALPILYTLNARYPNNSTLLNNLGQAHYGLGDIAEAEKFLIAAVQITPLHPQANMTVARIQMSRGNNQAAQASLHKALQGGFSNAKEEQLRKAGGELTADDVRWRRPMPQDPLGLENFVIPEWPIKAADLPAATVLWQAFHRMAGEQTTSLGRQQQRVSDSMDAKTAMQAAMTSGQSPFMLKASKLMENITEQYAITYERQMTALVDVTQKHGQASLDLNKKIEAIDEAGEEQYRYVPGGYAYEYTCGEVNGLIDNHLSTFNSAYAEIQNDILATQRRYLNETAYLAQYSSSVPQLFEAAKLSAKATFAQSMHNLRVALFEGMEARAVCFAVPEPVSSGGKLANFDDIHCEYISTLNMPGLGSIISRCNVTEANFDPIFAPFKASWATESDDNNINHLTRASAQVTIEGVTVGGHSEFDVDGIKSGGLSIGVSGNLGQTLKGGPLEIGVQVGVTMGMEFDRSGITDVSVNAGVGSSSTSTIGQTEMARSQGGVTAGVDSSWSWNSGFGGEVSAGFDSSVF